MQEGWQKMSEFKKGKSRYSIPEPIFSLLFYDDEYFRGVSKLRRKSFGFPKEDQWRDESGFNLSFALAGYSIEDIDIMAYNHTLSIQGGGISSEFVEESTSDKRVSLSKGNIMRGIARRKFHVKYIISEEFDVSLATAVMKHGLLHITIPEREQVASIIKIQNGE